MALTGLQLRDAEISYDPDFLSAAEADRYFQRLQKSLRWRQDRITLFGRQLPIPRLQAWYGDCDCDYRYSGLTLTPLDWTPELTELRRRIEQQTGYRFNAVLANLYRSGQDSIGWHSDNEKELGPDPILASLTLGTPRPFCLRHKQRRELKQQLQLAHGSLLLMAHGTQQHWLHALPKRRNTNGIRINLSFRYLQPGP